MDESVKFALRFEEGRIAARIGSALVASPYSESSGTDWQAWVAGFRSVDISAVSSADRARIFFEGWSAAALKMNARECPYLISDRSEEVELWMLGYMSADTDNPSS